MRNLALLSCSVLAACSLYGNKPPPDAVCAVAKEPANPLLRDPSNGACESFQDGCGCDPCGVCPPCGEPAPPAWPACSGLCEALDETTCLATAGCHAAYQEPANSQTGQFWGCWDITPLTPLEGGGCTGLDDLTCMEHDDCTSLYSSAPSYVSCNAKTTPPPCSSLTTEAACKAETGCTPIYDGSDCTCTPTACTCQIETFDHCQ